MDADGWQVFESCSNKTSLNSEFHSVLCFDCTISRKSYLTSETLFSLSLSSFWYFLTIQENVRSVISYVHVYVYKYVYVCLFIHVYMRTYVSVYICKLHVRISVSVYACVCVVVFMCGCVHACAYVHICMCLLCTCVASSLHCPSYRVTHHEPRFLTTSGSRLWHAHE